MVVRLLMTRINMIRGRCKSKCKCTQAVGCLAEQCLGNVRMLLIRVIGLPIVSYYSSKCQRPQQSQPTSKGVGCERTAQAVPAQPGRRASVPMEGSQYGKQVAIDWDHGTETLAIALTRATGACTSRQQTIAHQALLVESLQYIHASAERIPPAGSSHFGLALGNSIQVALECTHRAMVDKPLGHTVVNHYIVVHAPLVQSRRSANCSIIVL